MYITDCVVRNVAYKNFSDKDSEPLTEYIEQGIFDTVQTEIVIIVLLQHSILYGKLDLFLKRQGKIDGAFLYNVTSTV